MPDLVASAAEAGQPKVLKENMKTVTATVGSADLATRAVTLKGPDGKLMGFKAVEEVKNLPQLKAGDQVVLTYYESIAAQIMKPGTGPASAAQQAVATAKPGEKPAGAAVQQVTVIATVEAIDKNKQYVTLKGPEGESVEVKVRDPHCRNSFSDRICFDFRYSSFGFRFQPDWGRRVQWMLRD